MKYNLPDNHAILAHKIELSLTPKSLVYCAQSAGLARVAYNWALDKMNKAFLEREERLGIKQESKDERKKENRARGVAKRKLQRDIKTGKRPPLTPEEIKAIAQEEKDRKVSYEAEKAKNRELRITSGDYLPGEAEYRKQWNAEKEEKFPWVSKSSKCVAQQAIKNCGTAVNNHKKGRAKAPNYKKKFRNDSFYLERGVIDYYEEDHSELKKGQEVITTKAYLKVPKLPEPILLKEKLRFKGAEIISVTISRKADKWYASLQCDVPKENLPHNQVVAENQGAACGIDLGIKDFAIWAGLAEVGKEKSLKPYQTYLKRLARLQRENDTRQKTAKKKGRQKGFYRKKRTARSRQYRKTALQIALLHAKIANIRKDYCDKLSTYIVQHYAIIGLENLKVANMARNRKLSKSIMEQGWGMFREMIIRKAALYGREVFLVDAFYPSSKTCSCCEWKNDDLTLKDREWTCQECGVHHDRDINAGLNILREALRMHEAFHEGEPALKSISPSVLKVFEENLKLFYPEVEFEEVRRRLVA